MRWDNITWEKIVTEYANNPRDVITVPVTNKKVYWYGIFADMGI